MHDPRIGRFFAIDPLSPKYPHYTPYSFSGNKLIHAVELEGLEEKVLSENCTPTCDDDPNSTNFNPSVPSSDSNSENVKSASTLDNVMQSTPVQIASNNVAQGLYSGILRNQYELRVRNLKSLYDRGSLSNTKPWQLGLDKRYGIKLQTRNWMKLTPSMQYAMNNAHLSSKYHSLFRSFTTNRFEVKSLSISDPKVQSRLNSTGKPPRFF